MDEQKMKRKNKMPSAERKKKSDKISNYLILFMLILIGVTIMIIFKNSQASPTDVVVQQEAPKKEEQQEKSKKQKKLPPDLEITDVMNDPIVEQIIVDKNWQPTPTKQKGEHISMYVEDSLDWKEKMITLSNATSIKEDDMVVLRVGHNGNAQNAIGVVTSADGTQMYRVSMKWVDEEGWIPTQVEKLRTTEGAF